MNMFFRLTALAGLLAIAGQTFAVEDITRADQIPVLKEETQHATVSERVTSRFTRSHYRQFDLDQAFSAKIFDRYPPPLIPFRLQPTTTAGHAAAASSPTLPPTACLWN